MTMRRACFRIAKPGVSPEQPLLTPERSESVGAARKTRGEQVQGPTIAPDSDTVSQRAWPRVSTPWHGGHNPSLTARSPIHEQALVLPGSSVRPTG